MTNKEIIAENMMLLIANGVINENNSINYVLGWNRLGFKIKKGETAVTKFPIWKPKPKAEIEAEREEAERDGKEFVYRPFKLVPTSWFTNDQVEPLPLKKK